MKRAKTVMSVELTPKKHGWKVVFTRRTQGGGIDYSQNTTKTLDSALELIGSTCAVDGYEPQE
jgi:hypothetical protein